MSGANQSSETCLHFIADGLEPHTRLARTPIIECLGKMPKHQGVRRIQQGFLDFGKTENPAGSGHPGSELMATQRYSGTPHPIETLLAWVKSGELPVPKSKFVAPC